MGSPPLACVILDPYICHQQLLVEQIYLCWCNQTVVFRELVLAGAGCVLSRGSLNEICDTINRRHA
jgi:hypothetical protein